MFPYVALLLALLPSTLAIACGSTTPISDNPTLTFTAVGPLNCNLTFTATPGLQATCTLKLPGVNPNCTASDQLNFFIGATKVYGPTCGSQSFTLSTGSPTLTLNLKIAASADSITCSVKQPPVITTTLPPTTTPPVTPQAIVCGSTTPINATTTLQINAVGPLNCNLTFTAAPGMQATCTFKLPGVTPNCTASDQLNFFIGATKFPMTWCGSQSVTLTTGSPTLTLNLKISSSANSITCSVKQLPVITTTLPPTTTPPVTPQAIACGSTTPINATTTLPINAVGPMNCNLTFTAAPGLQATCTLKLPGVTPNCTASDQLNFFIGATKVYGPTCGSQSFTLSTGSPTLTLNLKIASSANSITCSVQQPPVITTTLPPTTTPLVTPPVNTTCKCGWDSYTRIVGGTNSVPNRFPWQARLILVSSTNATFLCGGTLIAPNWVLTAAHCVEGIVRGFVYLGDQSTSVTDTYENVFAVSTFVKHSLYNPSTLANDIALVKLPSNAVYTNGIQPACLPFKYWNSDLSGSIVTATGWGKTATNGSTATILQQGNMTVITNTVCSNTYGSIILPSNICTWQNGSPATCQGDSGGPLGLNVLTGVGIQDITYVVGVTSFTSSAGCTVSPSGFTRVTSYLNWIQQQTGASFCNK